MNRPSNLNLVAWCAAYITLLTICALNDLWFLLAAACLAGLGHWLATTAEQPPRHTVTQLRRRQLDDVIDRQQRP